MKHKEKNVITKMSRLMLVAGLSCLPFTTGATVITGSFSGYTGADESSGQRVTGALTLALNDAPVDSMASPEQSKFASSLEWVSLSLDGFNFGLPTDLSGYLIEDAVVINNEGARDVLTVQDRIRESASINAQVYLLQELRIRSELMDFLRSDSLEQPISWSDSAPGETDENFGLFTYQYLWRDDDLGIREVAEESVVITALNLAPPVHSVPEPGAGLLLMSGLLGLGVARHRRRTAEMEPA